ncbi:DUF7289 family protein [Halovenus sp. HT40]|uniref:DUF7289 family protein n=1 Tax=Halovenus sp. HT40 TaxID=3126691 RepID=UPI00300F2E3A
MTLLDRGVSDVVAFVLTFAIIIAGVGIVSTGGFDRLSEFTNDQQIDNSERGMEAAASTIDNLHRSNDTYRDFDLSLSGGNIWFNETAITIESSGINLSAVSPADDPNQAQIDLNALEHRFDSGDETVSIAYEGGGVFRTGTSRARYEPGITVEGDTTIISLVNLTTDETIDRSGAYGSEIALQPTGVPQEAPVSADNQFISFSAELTGQRQVHETSSSDSDIEIDISESAHPQQWEFYFEEARHWNEQSDVVYETDGIDTVLVRVSTIELSVLSR